MTEIMKNNNNFIKKSDINDCCTQDLNLSCKRRLESKISDFYLNEDDSCSQNFLKKFKMSSDKEEMFELFQSWALKSYGDQAKTKTITLKKKARIIKALNGGEHNNPDSSKFRFWVKSKGFTLRKSAKRDHHLIADTKKDHSDLFVVSESKSNGKPFYRKVAAVEEFFDIIYEIHAESGGSSGKHAGQKRTYKLICEKFAFLPREAVTRFLSICPSCKRNLRSFSPNRIESPLDFEGSQNTRDNCILSGNIADEFLNDFNIQATDSNEIKPITSTYLKMTRAMGLTDEEALKIDNLEATPQSTAAPAIEQNSEEAYAGLMKDADKLKLMLLAWNYQNSNAVRNGTEGPDLSMVGGLWAQYQNALALNAKQPSVSPVHSHDQTSPGENQDETNSSGQKDEDEGSEDESDDKLDQNAQDPERLKAFNMFVRLFVDENLDRMIPISKQPKEKIQAIIDSCARQFPEFCERSRKRIRTYLKSCRRNKKAREGWDSTSRPTPAHLTSVQAEQILAIACENESMNAKRMRIGLDPISQSMPLPTSTNSTTDTIAPSISYPGYRSSTSMDISHNNAEAEATIPSSSAQNVTSARSSPLALNSTIGNDIKQLPNSSTCNATNGKTSSPIYRPADFASPTSTSSPYGGRTQSFSGFYPNSTSGHVTATDLSMKQSNSQQSLTAHLSPSSSSSSSLNPVGTTAPTNGTISTGRPPLLSHKLNPSEMNAVRQLITGYRESAAFLLRSADELEQLLFQQQQH